MAEGGRLVRGEMERGVVCVSHHRTPSPGCRDAAGGEGSAGREAAAPPGRGAPAAESCPCSFIPDGNPG